MHEALSPTREILQDGLVYGALHIVATDLLTDLLFLALNKLNWITRVILIAENTENKKTKHP